MPKDPTSPDGWKIYDLREAVIFAARWTGLDESVVQEILTAKQRYMELAGLAETDAEDPSLEAERYIFAGLLPVEGRRLDSGITEYLVRVTGHDETMVDHIERGETAYLDALGLVEWESPEERSRALGTPDPKGLE